MTNDICAGNAGKKFAIFFHICFDQQMIHIVISVPDQVPGNQYIGLFSGFVTVQNNDAKRCFADFVFSCSR